MPKDTETLDRLYLEWSQFTSARTKREIDMVFALEEIAATGTHTNESGEISHSPEAAIARRFLSN